MDSKKIAILIFSSLFFAGLTHAMELTKYGDHQVAVGGPNFSGASIIKIPVQTIQVGDEHLRLISELQFIGNDFGTVSLFQKEFGLFMANFSKGIRLTEQKIVVTPEDEAKIRNFSDFMIDNLFASYASDGLELSGNFSNFKKQPYKKGVKNFTLADNSMLHALMFFFDENKDEATIKHSVRSYNNYKFTFMPLSADKDKYAGERIKLNFKNIDHYRFTSLVTAEANDVIACPLFSGFGNRADAWYKIAAFKIAEDTYRLEITISTLKDLSSPERISNFLVKIKV
jgi:hypothetical protein